MVTVLVPLAGIQNGWACRKSEPPTQPLLPPGMSVMPRSFTSWGPTMGIRIRPLSTTPALVTMSPVTALYTSSQVGASPWIVATRVTAGLKVKS